MALTIEDGSNVDAADSYADIAFADAYASAIGNTDWAKLGQTAKEQALILAQQFMFIEYSSRWKGTRANQGQSLDWPRSGVVGRDGYEIDDDVIPDDILTAQTEYAIIQATDSNGLYFTPPQSDTGSEIASIRQKADVVEQEIVYNAGTKATRRLFPKADGLVKFYLFGGGQRLAVRL